MTTPRKTQICLDSTRYYHCVSRCVRRAFLCGYDALSKRSFEHRRDWIEDRLHELAGIFAIDLCAYAVMSNHYHVILRVNPERAKSWSQEEVVTRWGKLFAIPAVLSALLRDDVGELTDQSLLVETIEKWRARLADISWFMRCVNEFIARKSNAEDDCTGRFWEGRFSSQALLDECSLLQCMTYVDLNPIRAGIAESLETSLHTSIKSRIDSERPTLLPFHGRLDAPENTLPCSFHDYLQLVDWTGRAVRDDKPGAIRDDVPPILGRLGIEPKCWSKSVKNYGSWYYRAVGAIGALRKFRERVGRQWLKGERAAYSMLSSEIAPRRCDPV